MNSEISKIKILLAAGCALLMLVLAYGRSFGVPFYLDDFPSLVNSLVFANERVDWGGLYAEYPRRWLTYASFGLNVELAGLAPAGFHALSIAIHAAVSMLVAMLAYGMSGLVWEKERERRLVFTAFAAVLVMLHPLNSQAVVYSVQRATLLMAMFYVGAVLAYVWGRQSNKPQGYALVVLLGLASWFSKENAATLPLSLLLVEGIFFQQGGRAVACKVLPFAAVIVAWGALESVPEMSKYARDTWLYSRSDYLATELVVLWEYIGRFFIPLGLKLEYDSALKNWASPVVWAALAGHLTVIVGVLRLGARWRLLTYGVLFYYVAHFVESSVVPLKDLAFEHRTYLPNIGLALAVSAGVTEMLKARQGWLWRGVVGVAVVLAVLTALRVELWRTPLAFYQRNAEASPMAYRAWLGLSAQYARLGDMAKADAAVSRALHVYQSRFDGLSEDVLTAYVRIKADTRQYAEVVRTVDVLAEKLRQSRAGSMNSSSIYTDYGRSKAMLGDLAGAEAAFAEALTLDPRNVGALNNMGILKSIQKEYGQARSYLEKALTIEPGNVEVRRNLLKLEAVR